MFQQRKNAVPVHDPAVMEWAAHEKASPHDLDPVTQCCTKCGRSKVDLVSVTANGLPFRVCFGGKK